MILSGNGKRCQGGPPIDRKTIPLTWRERRGADHSCPTQLPAKNRSRQAGWFLGNSAPDSFPRGGSARLSPLVFSSVGENNAHEVGNCQCHTVEPLLRGRGDIVERRSLRRVPAAAWVVSVCRRVLPPGRLHEYGPAFGERCPKPKIRVRQSGGAAETQLEAPAERERIVVQLLVRSQGAGPASNGQRVLEATQAYPSPAGIGGLMPETCPLGSGLGLELLVRAKALAKHAATGRGYRRPTPARCLLSLAATCALFLGCSSADVPGRKTLAGIPLPSFLSQSAEDESAFRKRVDSDPFPPAGLSKARNRPTGSLR